MSGDPERDGKARPTAPAGVLGGSGKRPESGSVQSGVEAGARAPKSAFAHTIAMPTAAPAPSQPENLNASRGHSDAAEPLRDPSGRPAPTPYKRERAQGPMNGTLPMPELSKPIGTRSEERMIAAKAVEVHGAAKVGTREATVQMPTTAGAARAPGSNRPLPAAPPPSGAPPAMPSLGAPAKSPVPPPATRDEHSVPRLSLGVEKIPSGKPAAAEKLDLGQSMPLQLSLKPSDHVESSLRPESQVPQRSMLPWIALAVIVILGGVAFAMMGGDAEPAPVTQDRVQAVPAVEPTGVATPTPTTEPPQAATPTAPAVPATPPPVEKPQAPAAAPVEAKKPAPETKNEEPARTSTRKKARRTTKKPASGPVLKVTPEGEGDLEEALRAAERMAEPEEEDLEPPEPPSAEPPSPD
jgi:hypothetical protein